jgi:hypothetical protein
MANTVKQRILDAIDARFKTILVANGYETDAGQNVFWSRTESVPETKLPAIVYRDTVNRPEVGPGALYENTLTVQIDGFVMASTDSDAKILLDKLRADIEKAIKVDDTWGDLALTTEKESDESTLDRKERVYGWIAIEISIEYWTNRWDAYA